ncbi:hypothetical protein PROFUN_13449 [Planoprotostelium fungivorum]|uniref:Saposin B-type domain-containing protein n=1 Tax=Planoprotostelium fungivorum TaxID=1890364 RepID=A0A2P6N3Z4_9EUKA|nr:hypothetical protein PROFUN_13449 [Planoprotostelium fungivorum]
MNSRIAVFLCLVLAVVSAQGITQTVTEQPPTNGQPPNFLLCTTCKSVIGFAEALEATGLGGNITELIINACNFAPASEYEKCVKLIGGDIDKIVKPIQEQRPPLEICQGIKLCGTETATTTATAAPLRRPFFRPRKN